jgi:hypothetical protein
MTSLKPTPNWDDLGWGGIPREGQPARLSPESRVIAEIGEITPGLNPLSPYFSGLNWGRVGVAGDRIIGEIGNRDSTAEGGVATRGSQNAKVARNPQP